MPSLKAEIIGRYDHAGDASRLLYAPLDRPLTARETRCYVVDYEGDGAALATFLNKVLADPVSHALYSGSTPALHGYSFFLDYGMKSGALDLEKETIIAHHQGDASAAFKILHLCIHRRVYIFDADASLATMQLAERFVKDIVNPAIHTFKITAA